MLADKAEKLKKFILRIYILSASVFGLALLIHLLIIVIYQAEFYYEVFLASFVSTLFVFLLYFDFRRFLSKHPGKPSKSLLWGFYECAGVAIYNTLTNFVVLISLFMSRQSLEIIVGFMLGFQGFVILALAGSLSNRKSKYKKTYVNTTTSLANPMMKYKESYNEYVRAFLDYNFRSDLILTVRTDKLYKIYSKWCSNSDVSYVDKTVFIEILKSSNYKIEEKSGKLFVFGLTISET